MGPHLKFVGAHLVAIFQLNAQWVCFKLEHDMENDFLSICMSLTKQNCNKNFIDPYDLVEIEL